MQQEHPLHFMSLSGKKQDYNKHADFNFYLNVLK